MAHEPVADFEKEFYPFLEKIVKNPALLKQNAGELKRILNKLLVIKDRAELDSIVAGLTEIGLFKQKFYHHASAIVKEVEANIYALAAQKNKFGGLKPSTAARQRKLMEDYIKN